MSAGIILVHGYTGSTKDFKPLAQKLAAHYGNDSVTSICLHGHRTKDAPLFDNHAFTNQILSAVDTYLREKRKIIMIGHSTGGTLALSFILEYAFTPHLLILASVPKKIDANYIDRWNKHRSGKNNIPFNSIGKMVSLINFTGSQRFNGKFPVLIVHGKHDKLVPAQEALTWRHNSFDGQTRSVIIPSAGHNIFCGRNNASAIDTVVRAAYDIATPLKRQDEKAINRLSSIECEVKEFLTNSPLSERHLARCPSGQMLTGGNPSLSPVVKNEPVMANIEITTRCNLRCRYCARSIYSRQANNMPKELFSSILDMLPHAYRITLVGLGEPLLHPHIADFVAEASCRGRRVAVVTNAMCLDKSLSHELIRAGLHSIAFSIDGPNQDIASHVRHGTDFNRVINNIKLFTEISASTRPISTAVFSAVSMKTTPYLKQLIDVVAHLGVKVMMLTDLNFKQNLRDTLWKNADDHIKTTVQKAVAYAFSKRLPVLSVRGLEEFGLSKRYKKFLLLPPGQLYQRSLKHTWCFSPWQTMPIDVQGNITVCDCQPEKIVGSLLTQPLSMIWNGKTMTRYRRRMLSSDPPEACRICPRF